MARRRRGPGLVAGYLAGAVGAIGAVVAMVADAFGAFVVAGLVRSCSSPDAAPHSHRRRRSCSCR
jgi:hypothetical protein